MNTKQLEKYLKQAKIIQNNAYVPYSNFRVAAIVTMLDGQMIFGVNVENAAFPATICAERSALSQVISLGLNKNDIDSLFLITDSKDLGSPCGVCRQFMVEIMPMNAKVFISNSKLTDVSEIKTLKVNELLPFAFLPQSLIKGE